MPFVLIAASSLASPYNRVNVQIDNSNDSTYNLSPAAKDVSDSVPISPPAEARLISVDRQNGIVARGPASLPSENSPVRQPEP